MDTNSIETNVLQNVIAKLDDAYKGSMYGSVTRTIGKILNSVIVAHTLNADVEAVERIIRNEMDLAIAISERIGDYPTNELLCDVWQLLNPDAQFHLCLGDSPSPDDAYPADLTNIPF